MLDVHKKRCMNLFKHILNILAWNSIPLLLLALGSFIFDYSYYHVVKSKTFGFSYYAYFLILTVIYMKLAKRGKAGIIQLFKTEGK